MQRKLNEGKAIASYSIVEDIRNGQKCSLNKALKIANISMESYEAGKKLAKK